ncbi:hypothetical protein M569_06613 [Genlisea aurea]|uniref:Uncharacterized protein n=1 Tax=Genlisea aurea TaxID=192259 RepID=S8CN58_9LAMI|nr:hypothetical protein M569_06613 [Genlisea aurea]
MEIFQNLALIPLLGFESASYATASKVSTRESPSTTTFRRRWNVAVARGASEAYDD